MKFLILLFLGLAAAKVRYDGYQVYEIVPQSLKQLNELIQMQNWSELDFWVTPRGIGRPCHLMIPPKLIQHVLTRISYSGMKYSLINANVQTSLDAEETRFAEMPDTHVYNYSDYNSFDEFYPEMERLAGLCPSGFTCETYSIGSSYDGIDMRVLRINGGHSTGVWVDSHVHAREWLTGATVMMIVNRMITQYATDPEAAGLMDNFNWMFAPVMNPDGLIYSWTTDRLWRKTRSPNAGSSCIGTDMNRNWDDHWGGVGSSNNPCAQDYRGDGPECEIETQNIANEIRRLYPTAGAIAFVSIHSYGYYWLHSYGWTCVDSPDHAEQFRVADITANAVEATHNTIWERGPICQVLYEASGVTVDWVYSEGGIVYTYTPELRGTGFDPPPSEIVPSYEEIWNGMVAMVQAIANP